MENSAKKSGGVRIPKRNRSLDIKSLYKPRVSKVGGRKKKAAQENDQQNVKNKRKRSPKQVPLSCLEPDAKRSKKDVVNAVKSEPDSDEKSGGGIEGLHEISLCLAETSKAFSFPKRPRGTVGRKKLVSDQVLKPLEIPESGDRVGAFNVEVIKPKDESGLGDELVKLDSVSVGNDSVSRSKSAGKIVRSNVILAGKVVSSNIKYLGRGGGSRSKSAGKSSDSKLKTKRKDNSKSVGKVYSNVKLKRKAGTDEIKERQDGGSGSMPHSGEENKVIVNNRDASSSKKPRMNSRKKTDLEDGRDGAGALEKNNSKKKKDLVDNRDADEASEKNNSQKKKDLVDNRDAGEASEKKNSQKKKDLVDNRDADEALEKNNSRKKKGLVDGTDGDEALEMNNSRKKKGQVDGSDAAEASEKKNSGKKKGLVDGGDGDETSEKKNSRKIKDLVDSRDGDGAPKKSSSRKKKDLVDDRVGGEASNKNDNRKKMDIGDGRDGDETSKSNNSRKKKDLVDDRCGDEASEKNDSMKKKELGDGGNASKKNDKMKKKEFVDDGDGDEASKKNNSRKKNELVDDRHADEASEKNDRKKKDSVDGRDADEASEKKNGRKKKVSVDNRDGDKASEKKNSRKKKDSVDGRDGDIASKKNNSRKKKDLVDGRDGGEASIKKFEPSVGSSLSERPVGDFDEDDEDEENLEQNAARMLSSRFDPSCTGFPSKRRSSASQKVIGSSFPFSSTMDSSDQQANSSGGVGPALEGDDSRTDDKSRPLRPRREDQGKGMPRKRRHFYEISPEDIEPNWALNRKIKVFWPLDENWYDGIVNDYHPECKLYHIRYDDCDEEWIDLSEEKFKLLLFPSEVPGREKSGKVSRVRKDVHKVETVPPGEDDSCRETILDSEPIASWLSRSSQRSKSLQIAGTSQMGLPFAAAWSFEKFNSISRKVPGPKEKSSIVSESTSTASVVANECKSLVGAVTSNQLVYARKKAQTSGEGTSSVLSYGKKDRSASGTVNSFDPISVSFPATEKVDFEKQIWSIDQQGKLCLNVRWIRPKRFRMQMLLPLLHYSGFLLQTVDYCLLQNIFMVQHGVILPTSPGVILEMLFIDRHRGVNFLLFEGCMKQVLAVVSQILIVFSQADEPMNSDMQSPVTSIRFRLSAIQDPKKNHVFELHSFSRLCNSKWVCLESNLLQKCLLLKQLPTVECSYDNIKEFEYGSLKHSEPHVSSRLSSHAGLNKKFAWGILPFGVCRAACTTSSSQPTSNLAEKPGEIPHFVLSFSTAPTCLLSLHLHLLMANSSASHSLPGSDDQSAVSLPPTVTSIPSKTSDCGSGSKTGPLIVEIPPCDQVDIPLDRKECISKQAPGVAHGVIEGFEHSPNPMDSRCASQGVRSSLISSPPENLYPRWTDKRPTFMRRGFSDGPKKPRTQVQYTLPGAGYNFSAKQKMESQKSPPYKRIRRASVKKISEASRGNRKNFDLLVCDANVLVTRGDKGWRECGALIVLEGSEHSEWRLAVKLSGITKFSYKVNHILQPGTTNRYSHAVLWKGGKDWVLEFTDRSQWNLFKEMHEECYNRNVRAASVKNIPIPGVLPIDESDDYGTDVLFSSNPIKYLRQLENDVEMALDPSRILYDMDSDDEQWLMLKKKSGSENGFEKVSEDVLEKTIDIFEKVSYVKHRDNFTDDEIQELASGLVSVEAVKLIYEHWKDKRGRNKMPLLRHLQPPLWERYQQQLKEWEKAVARGNSAASAGIQEKAPIPEKPPMFAFCLKPRGLDVRNKSFKHRSQRRFPVSAHLNSGSGAHDSFYVYGRRSNGHNLRRQRALVSSSIHGSPDVSPSLPPSMRMLSPRVAHYTLSAAVSVASPSPRVYRTGRKKLGQQTVSHRRRKRNGAQQQDVALPDSSSQMNFFSEEPCAQSVENMGDIDLIECRLREASAAAQRACEVAKLKRERANRLLNKADIAVQRAAAALMTADAIKAACESSNAGR